MPDLYGALDLGGTNVRAIIAALDGKVLADCIQPSRAQDGLDATLDSMVDSLNAAAKEAKIEVGTLAGLGICSAGWVDSEKGIVPAAPQLRGWHNVPLTDIMRERTGVRAWLENDANAAALGEHVFGAGKGARHMVYITVSTGIGGGIIADDKLYGGAKGSAGEIGHTIIDPAGPQCGCGNYGCLESLASGTAIAKRGVQAATSGESPKLAAIKEKGERITAENMAQAALAGDAACIEIFSEAGRFLGIALANLVNLLSPELILIGGGVAHESKLFLPQAEGTMRTLGLSEPLKHVKLGLAELGDLAGPLGMIARLRELAA
ncbi:MAG: ROK family protein [Chloroflexota bacterium]